jgi:hypothetical protein
MSSRAVKRSGQVAKIVTAERFPGQVTKLSASQWERYWASKSLGVRVARQVTGRVAGIVDFYVEPRSDKALGESPGE